MKDWKFIKTGNEAVGPNWDKKRQLEDELRGWMTSAQKLTGEEKANAEKQIAEIRKELNDVKIKIAHGENKKTGNESIEVPKNVMDVLRSRYNKAITESQAYEKLKSIGLDEEKAKRLSKDPGNFTQSDFLVKNESIDKQEWSMFKGLSKDAEKEVGNAYTPNPELIKVLEAWLHNRMSEQEARAKIMKITGDKNITDMMIHSPGGFIPAGNKVGNKFKLGEYVIVTLPGGKRVWGRVLKDDGNVIKYMQVDSNGDEFGPERVATPSEVKAENKKTGNETLGQWAKAKPRVINETAEEKKFGKVMREFDRGELKSSSGETVTNPEQAKAIAYSESEKVNNLKRARNSMVKNAQITLWNGNDSVLISENGLVQYLENNSFETDRDKYDSQEKAVEELTKKGYHKK